MVRFGRSQRNERRFYLSRAAFGSPAMRAG